MSTLGFQLSKQQDGEKSSPRQTDASLYDHDFFLWTQQQAQCLRESRWDGLDVENLVDEVETLGRSVKREIKSRLLVLLVHLLKWRFQPTQRSSNWKGTIVEQRRRIAEEVEGSPSLKNYPDEVLRAEYEIARLKAAGETNLAEDVFPQDCPFSIDEILDDEFYPKGEGE